MVKYSHNLTGNEDRARVVQGKHVIVSLGERGTNTTTTTTTTTTTIATSTTVITTIAILLLLLLLIATNII